MKLSIAIVCSNDHLISRCLNSIPADVPIIAVLNFPDEYVQNVVEQDSRVKICRWDERNLGKLRQVAVENCDTPAICFIDSDCVIGNDMVSIVEKELDDYYAVNIPVRYEYNNKRTKAVSDCRQFTTPDSLLLMPFAFRISLQKKIGNLFNDKLSWGEDSDQRKRMKEQNIEYGISKAIVYHKILTIKEDAKSAIRLGRGTYIQEKNINSKPRKLLKDLSIIHEIKSAHKCYKFTKQFNAALYHFFIWRPAYKYGYWKVRMRKNAN